MARNNGEKPLLSDELRNRERYVYGPASITGVPVSDINVLPQIRTEFDPVGINELADSMLVYKKTGEQYVIVGFDLQEPTVVAKLTTDEAVTYTVEHAFLHNKPEPAEVKVSEDGFVYILIAGERRVRAIRSNMDYTGLDIERTEVMCSIQEGISLLEAHGKQLTENVHDRPSPLDEAVGIRQTRDYLTMRFPGQFPNVADIVRISGRGESVVRNALAFTSLPPAVQALAEKRKFDYESKKGKEKERKFVTLPYSVVIRLKPLEEAYRRKYRGLEAPKINEDTYTTNMLLAFANQLLKRRSVIKSHRKSRVSGLTIRLIENQIKGVNAEAMFSTDMDAFMIEEESGGGEISSITLMRSRRDLARVSIQHLDVLRNTDGLSTDIVDMLRSVYARIEAGNNSVTNAAAEVEAVYQAIASEHPDLADIIE